jgi:hypothetical protein
MMPHVFRDKDNRVFLRFRCMVLSYGRFPTKSSPSLSEIPSNVSFLHYIPVSFIFYMKTLEALLIPVFVVVPLILNVAVNTLNLRCL